MTSPKSLVNRIKTNISDEKNRYIEYLGVLFALMASVSGFLALEYGENFLPIFQEAIVVLLEKTFVIVGIAYLITKASFFGEILDKKFTKKNIFLLIIILGALSVFANHTGADYLGANANVRDLAPMVGGLIAGPFVGVAVGIIGAIDRFLLGGPTYIPCTIATFLAGLFSGIIYILNKGKFVGVLYAVIFSALYEIFHITLVMLTPYDLAFTIVKELSIPIILANSVGMLIFAIFISNEIKEREQAKEMALYHEEAELYEHELEVAREIQDKFWKIQTTEIKGMEMEILDNSKDIPKRHFYDVFSDEMNKTSFVVGYVDDKTLLSSFIGTHILTEARERINNDISLIKMIKFLNWYLSIYKPFKITISLYTAEFDPKNKILKYLNLGDIISMVYQSNSGEMDLLDKFSYYLGSKTLNNINEFEIKLEKDDLILILLFKETMNLSNQTTIKDSIGKLIKENNQIPLKELKMKVQEFFNINEGYDSQICILLLKVD
jgi:phosphoserine phosphatase RsbU/P